MTVCGLSSPLRLSLPPNAARSSARAPRHPSASLGSARGARGCTTPARSHTSSNLAAMNKYLAPSNKPRTRSKATKNLLTLSQHRRRSDPQDGGSNRSKEEINVASLQTAGQHANENRRVGDRRRAWEGRLADCLGRRCRRFGHCFGGHVVAAVIIPQPQVPLRLGAGGHPRSYSISSGCSHLARCLSGPALEGMRECAHLMKAEEPGNFGYMQLAIIEISDRQIVPQLLKYFSEVQPFIR
jgi:hypothetical protein